MENPFGKIRNQTEVKSVNPFGRNVTETEVLSGEDPLMKGLDQNREEQDQREPVPTSRQTEGIRSADDLYGAVEDKYSDVPPGVHPFDKYQLSDKQQMDQMAREDELQRIYNRTGQEETIMGVPVRVQTERKNNPNFDPSLPEDPETNPAYVDKKYLVDRPDSNTFRRMAYQVFENIAGGVGDFVTEGKLLTEGDIGKALPDTVPSGEGEQLATELTTFVLGPAAIGKAVKTGAEGVKAISGMAGQVAKYMSPEATQAMKSTYDAVLKATGSKAKAFAASNGFAKRIVVGMALGMEESVVAPDTSESIVSPDIVQRTFGVSKERARDIAFVLDSPIISQTLSTLGGIYQTAKDKFIRPTFGGLRNLGEANVPILSPLAKGVTTNSLTINEKDAGLRLLQWLDPNLSNASPEEFVYRVNVLSGALDRKATKNMQLAGANADVNLDTPAAFTEIAKDYYDLSYSHLKDALGVKEYNEFIDQQARQTAQKLFELKTAIVSDPTVASQTAKSSQTLEQLFNDAADSMPSGTLAETQEQAGQILGGTQIDRVSKADQMVDDARTQMEASKAASETGIMDNPEFKQLLDEYINNAGSTASIENRLKDTVAEPMFRSFKKLKTDVDEAYKKVAESGAEGDANSILEIIGPEGVQDPVLKKIAENVNSDSSYANISNNVRNLVSKEIKRAQSAGDPEGRLDTLLAIRKNISEDQLDFLIANGDDDVVQLAQDAKDKFINLQTSWRDQRDLKNLTETSGKARLRGENLPKGVGPGQGVTDWNIDAIRTVQRNLDGADGEIFRQSLDRAAKAGGEDVSTGIAEYATSKSLANIANRVASGNKESISTLRQGLKEYANILENINSPLVGDIKKLEVNIQTLENAAKSDAAAYEKVLAEAESIKQKAGQSVLRKFVSHGEPLGQSDMSRTMNNIFNARDSEAQIRNLLSEVDQLGDEGKVVKEALQSSYLDYLKGRLFSNRSIGVADISDGMIKQGYKVNEINVRKIFEENSKDQANFRLLFADTPEVFDQIKEVTSTFQNLTRTTAKNDAVLKQSIDKSSDPVQGTNSLIQFTLGVLNPTATRVKRLVGPMAASNLEQIQQAQGAIMLAMITDPKSFSNIAKRVSKNVEDREAKQQMRALVARAAGRAWTSNNPVEHDMENLK